MPKIDRGLIKTIALLIGVMCLAQGDLGLDGTARFIVLGIGGLIFGFLGSDIFGRN